MTDLKFLLIIFAKLKKLKMNKDLYQLVLIENGVRKHPALIAGVSITRAERLKNKMHCSPNQRIRILKWSKK